MAIISIRSRRAQGVQHHSRVARLDHDQPLAPAQGDAADADGAGFDHRRPDHAEGLNRDRTVRIDVIRVLKYTGSTSARGTRSSVAGFAGVVVVASGEFDKYTRLIAHGPSIVTGRQQHDIVL
jgi:hypothetical protein